MSKKAKSPFKPSCIEFEDMFPEVENEAARLGLMVKVSVTTCGKGRKTLHVQFNDDKGNRILNYYPGNSTFYAPGKGTGKANGHLDAVRIAGEAMDGGLIRIVKTKHKNKPKTKLGTFSGTGKGRGSSRRRNMRATKSKRN